MLKRIILTMVLILSMSTAVFAYEINEPWTKIGLDNALWIPGTGWQLQNGVNPSLIPAPKSVKGDNSFSYTRMIPFTYLPMIDEGLGFMPYVDVEGESWYLKQIQTRYGYSDLVSIHIVEGEKNFEYTDNNGQKQTDTWFVAPMKINGDIYVDLDMIMSIMGYQYDASYERAEMLYYRNKISPDDAEIAKPIYNQSKISGTNAWAYGFNDAILQTGTNVSVKLFGTEMQGTLMSINADGSECQVDWWYISDYNWYTGTSKAADGFAMMTSFQCWYGHTTWCDSDLLTPIQ